jgi:predicted amidophosphoribosyltransferase
MANIRPQKITGSWKEGFVLDFHTLESKYLGDDEYGHPQFENVYSEIGKLLHLLKSKKDRSAIDPIAAAAVEFVRGVRWQPQVVVTVPPSRYRFFQPLKALSREVAERLQVEFCEGCVKKIKSTPQLKNVFDYERRKELLSDAFQADHAKLIGKRVLLLDDLYRSGATMNSVTIALMQSGNAAAVYALAITKTRALR